MSELSGFITGIDLLLGVGVTIFFVVLLSKSSIMEKCCLGGSFFLYLLGFMFVYIVSLVNYVVGILPFFPDAYLYSDLYVNGQGVHYLSFSKKIYYWVLQALAFPLLGSIAALIGLQWVAYLGSYVFLSKAWGVCLKKEGFAVEEGRLSFMLFLFYPAVFMFVGLPMREAFFLLGFSVFIYGLVVFTYYGGGFNWLLLGALLAILMRVQFVVILVTFLSMSFLFSDRLRKYFPLVACFPVVVFFVFMSYSGYEISPEWFAYIRSDAAERYSDVGHVYGEFFWPDYFSLIMDLPVLVLQFMFSPWPLLHGFSVTAFASYTVDLIYVLAIYLFSSIFLYRNCRFWFFIVLVGFVISGFWEFYIGGAVRHRIPMVLMLIFPAAIVLKNLKRRLVVV